MAGKKAMDDDQEMGKKARMGGKVPPQFLPKQKGKPTAKASKGKPMAKKK